MVFGCYDLSENEKKEKYGAENPCILITLLGSIGKYAEFFLL